MKYSMLHQLVLIFIVNTLLNCTYALHWSGATEDKCQFTINVELTIYFPDNLRLFVSQFKRANVSECRYACCTHETCNGYVWDTMDTDNCKLLKCSSQGQDCKKALKPSTDIAIGEVGFITGITEDSSPVPTLPPFKGKSNTLSDSLTWLSQRLQGQDAKPANATKRNNVARAKNHTTPAKTSSPQHNQSRPKAASLNTSTRQKHDPVRPKNTPAPTTNSVVRSSVVSIIAKEESTAHTHTNDISLSIALLFGLSFFVTVVFILGKRWVEGVRDQHKRGYTRISYLLNGV
ncbi:uncharacterized protein LOC130655558 [Hydractinia symbiolongicarpus]|uniref:uncharacterized protein LOC130655558 n=1 Tax=Hydractinia symbiolongicarpus TaxID=13093 RepID=UPI00254A0E0B|nr:uncharacterized protein LOC130655558 [Hydractinia symbiolongicarpus]